MFLVANKCDLADLEEVSTRDAQEISIKYNTFMHQTSAKDGTGINQLFRDIAEQILIRQMTKDSIITEKSED